MHEKRRKKSIKRARKKNRTMQPRKKIQIEQGVKTFTNSHRSPKPRPAILLGYVPFCAPFLYFENHGLRPVFTPTPPRERFGTSAPSFWSVFGRRGAWLFSAYSKIIPAFTECI